MSNTTDFLVPISESETYDDANGNGERRKRPGMGPRRTETRDVARFRDSGIEMFGDEVEALRGLGDDCVGFVDWDEGYVVYDVSPGGRVLHARVAERIDCV